MKKAVLILLILIYSLSSFGVTFKEFYCCGKLKSFSVTLAEIEKNNSGKGKKEDGCCKTDYQCFKVKDTHVAASHINAPLIFYTDLQICFPSFHGNILIAHSVTVANVTHSPPLYRSTSIYLSNGVFRI